MRTFLKLLSLVGLLAAVLLPLIALGLAVLSIAAALQGAGFACLAVVRCVCVECLGRDPGDARAFLAGRHAPGRKGEPGGGGR